MDLYQKLVERDLSRLAKNISQDNKNNLSMEERQSLDKLHKNSSIVIKNADKEGAVVVLDADLYKKEASWQLSDITTYRKLKSDPTTSFRNELSTLLDRAVAVGIFFI